MKKMKFLVFLLLTASVSCFGQKNSNRGTIKVKKHVVDATIYTKVDVMPEFSYGNAGISKFISSNLNYPRAAVERGSSGTCFITFAVNTDGSVSNILILKGVSGCPECDLEAFKVIKMMPKWTPGRNKGETVRVQINMPIRFTLQ
jgi:protein TonB